VRDRDDPALAWQLDLTRDWCVPIERRAASRLVVVREVLGENPQQMSLIENDHMIQALAANRADPALDVWILPWRAVGDDDLLDAQVLDALAEVLAVNAVMIPGQEARGFFPSRVGPEPSWRAEPPPRAWA